MDIQLLQISQIRKHSHMDYYFFFLMFMFISSFKLLDKLSSESAMNFIESMNVNCPTLIMRNYSKLFGIQYTVENMIVGQIILSH